ncbi:MAG TPA: carbohydrate kinase [Nocardioidaceae bacterium]|nr:carbohydrate kinase [Nocardioidaceae bacterium]
MTTAPHVLVVGEALVDVVDGIAHPGGSPANVAVALGRQGVGVTLATQLADDEYGELLRAHLTASGVELVIATATRTSSATAVLDATGAASYSFDIEWAPSFPELPAADVVHVGSFSALSIEPPPGLLSYDINVRPALMPDDALARVERLVDSATIVKASDEDLAWLYPSLSWQEAAVSLLTRGPQIVWVTLGAEGAIGFTSSGRFDISAPKVEVVDTIGAGDTFSAGLIGGWLSWGDDWQRVGEHAAGLAAQTASRRGADPPRV